VVAPSRHALSSAPVDRRATNRASATPGGDVSSGSSREFLAPLLQPPTDAVKFSTQFLRLVLSSLPLFERSRLLLNTQGVAQGTQLVQRGSGSYTDPQMWKLTLAP
jgi:hypothetical protein